MRFEDNSYYLVMIYFNTGGEKQDQTIYSNYGGKSQGPMIYSNKDRWI